MFRVSNEKVRHLTVHGMGADEHLWENDPIPTMNEWGMIVLSLLLGGFGLWCVRRGAVA